VRGDFECMPERAGGTGAVNSVGVAVTGLVFFGALRHGYNVAFTCALAELAATLVIAAALTRRLRPPPRETLSR